MKKFLFLYWNPPPADQPPSPEEMQAMMKQWADWKESFKEQILDMGDGLHHSGRCLAGGDVTDGPYAEAKEIVGGFSIVQAESYDQALEVARACPIIHMPSSTIEIREMMGM